MQSRLLLIEDDYAIADMVQRHLSKEGFVLSHAADGEAALRLLAQETYQLILLDLMLPGVDGMEVLRYVRASSTVPVLILSAKDSDVDKALGLGFGADDYLAKPFSLIELTARVKAALRRASQYAGAATVTAPQQHVLRVHELTLHTEEHLAMKRDQPINLTAKELLILKLLMTYPKRAFSKEQIYRAVWNDDYLNDVNAIQVHISRLRDKIEDEPATPKYIKTVWGIGYKMGEFRDDA
ncbi:response regulator transcription factor [Paenibacillus sp. CF384]|uniref:response regulator transcription factor n=1 Tax=Paenibacillus sp. CF384 TaxID=1884382 RepID=UPI0008997806|nr:response regulator transcription factor [Paenibacillus sp. CF384]SDW19932.1 DNA-binding response regulator, OmpR family, contains REC and winged-helix (wHTH) domain [Paenibacillus sp. CF384]